MAIVTIPSKIGFIHSDSIQIKIEFDTADPANTNYTIEQAGIVIDKLGDLEYDFDLEELLITPGNLTIEIFDSNDIVGGFINDVAIDAFGFDYVKKNAKVTLLLNGAEEFVGKIQTKTIRYNRGLKILKFIVDCDTEILNKRMVYDEEGIPLNPLNLIFGPADQLNTHSVPFIIKKIYEFINPNIDLEIFHTWVFNCSGRNFITRLPESRNLPLLNLEQSIIPLFQINQYGVSTLGDVLRKMAIDWGCFTGVLSTNKAFFRQLFTYDESYTQNLGKVFSWNITYPFTPIDYVKAHLKFTVRQAGERVLEPDIYSIYESTHESGIFTELQDRFLSRKSFLGFNFSADATSVSALAPQFNGWAISVKVLEQNGFQSYGDAITSFWLHNRFSTRNCRVDEFLVQGINYDFLRGFSYLGKKYQIIGMKKRYSEGLTHIKALMLPNEQ